MKKIMVIGCPGSGKSTFSKKLHNIIGVPLYHLDMLYWNSNGTNVKDKIFLNRLLDIIQKEEWIIDGNYSSTIELRLSNCDTVIFLDYPLDVCLSGIEERKCKPRSDIPWIEPKEVDPDFIEFVKLYNYKNRPYIMDLLNKYADKNIYIFKNRDDANSFLIDYK